VDRKEVKDNQLAEREKEIDKLAQRYKTLFASANGKKVLCDMERAFGANYSSVRQENFDPNRVLFFEGKRSAFLYIKRLLEREKNG